MSDGSTKEIRVLDGESYSSALLNAADKAQKRGADGAIGADDANAILEAKESDGELRKKTIDFIRGHYKFTKDAEPVFQAGNEKPAKLKKSRTKSSEKVMPPPRTDKPQRKRKASSKLLEAQANPRIHDCFDAMVKTTPGPKALEGTTTVHFIVAKDTGLISNVGVIPESTTAQPPVAQCVVTALNGLKLDPPDGVDGDATFAWQFVVQ